MGVLAPVRNQTTPAEKRWTQAEFHQLPEGPPYYELEEGELLEMVRPRGRHQKIMGKLFAVISPHVEENELGDVWPEVEVDVTRVHTYVPDLVFLTTEHLSLFEADLRIVGAPDLVVEITSPSTAVRDESTKLDVYQQAGVPWYWVVDTDTLVIHEYKNTDDGYLLAQAVAPGEAFAPKAFPGLSFNLAALLGEIDEDETETDPAGTPTPAAKEESDE